MEVPSFDPCPWCLPQPRGIELLVVALRRGWPTGSPVSAVPKPHHLCRSPIPNGPCSIVHQERFHDRLAEVVSKALGWNRVRPCMHDDRESLGEPILWSTLWRLWRPTGCRARLWCGRVFLVHVAHDHQILGGGLVTCLDIDAHRCSSNFSCQIIVPQMPPTKVGNSDLQLFHLGKNRFYSLWWWGLHFSRHTKKIKKPRNIVQPGGTSSKTQPLRISFALLFLLARLLRTGAGFGSLDLKLTWSF